MAIIRAKVDLHNGGLCFKKGKEYKVHKTLPNRASLTEVKVINELGEPHLIGGWWRQFEIVSNLN